jgi:hypothetical protein
MGGYQVGPSLAKNEPPFPRQWETSPEVKACPHDVWESVLIDSWHLEEAIRCRACHAPRCGFSRDPDPCMLVRHHATHHVQESGRLDPIGGIKCSNGVGCGCGARYAS